MKVKAGKSSIHGKGLFAKEAISEGELIGRFELQPTDRDGTHVLWIWQGQDLKPFKASCELKYANHSDSPNTQVVEEEMHAIRPIEPGEEITFHYGEEW